MPKLTPICGGRYYVRPFTARKRIDVLEAHPGESDDPRAAQEWMAVVVAATLCDKGGKPLCADKDAALDFTFDTLEHFDEAFEVALKVNGIGKQEHGDREKD